jgi:hypothetical protein
MVHDSAKPSALVQNRQGVSPRNGDNVTSARKATSYLLPVPRFSLVRRLCQRMRKENDRGLLAILPIPLGGDYDDANQTPEFISD